MLLDDHHIYILYFKFYFLIIFYILYFIFYILKITKYFIITSVVDIFL